MKIKVKDFYQFKCLSELSLSPDGGNAAFVATTPNQDGWGYSANIYLHNIKSGETVQITARGDSKTYVWGDNSIIFPGKRGQAAVGSTEFYQISLSGGEAICRFTIPFAVSQVKQVSHGLLAFTARFDHNKAAHDKLTADQQKEEQDYVVIDELPFWQNGGGYTNKTRTLLYTYDIATQKVTQVSNKWMDIGFFNVQDGVILYSGTTYKDKKPKTVELRQYNPITGQNQRIIAPGKYKIQSAGFAFGKTLVMASDMKQHGINQIPSIYSVDSSGELHLVYKPQYGFGSSVGSDSRYGSGSTVKYTADAMYFITSVETNSELHKLTADGKVQVVVSGQGSVDMLDVQGSQVVYIGMRDQKLQELYTPKKQLTKLNSSVLEGKDVVRPEAFDIVSDGVKIQGFVMKPANYDPKKSYPAITNVHGGPRTIYGSVYVHEMQVWANMGYFVFFSNPRGSDGRGDIFGDLRGKYGTIDYDDFMRFTDAVLEKYPQIDQKRVGITGGSYGGFMTNWAIGHTRRFAAAVSQRSLCNWISLSNTADIGYTFDTEDVGGTAWRNMSKIWNQSPLKYANKAKTPTLFIHAEEDYRCPLSEGMQMFYAIKVAGCTARMCIFKGENHELSRSGKPRHRVRRLEEITNWFEKYLKEVK